MKIYFTKWKNEKNGTISHFKKCMDGFIEDSCHLISTIAFILLPYIVLCEVYNKNLASHRYTVGKGRSILVAFLDNCSITPKQISHQNSKRNNFFKGYWKCRNWNNTNELFEFCCIMTQSSTLHFEWIFHLHVIMTLCICLLENTD